MKRKKTINLREKAVDLAYAALDLSISASRTNSKGLMRLSVQTKHAADTLRNFVEGNAYKQEVLSAFTSWEITFNHLTEEERFFLHEQTQEDLDTYQIYEEQKGRKPCRKQDTYLYIMETWIEFDSSVKKKFKK